MMDTNIDFRDIDVNSLELNVGQVPGLPKNPRQWTYNDVENLKKSIIQSPEMVELRGLIVYPYCDRYVVIGGNMRLTAIKSLGWKSAPCAVLDSCTPTDKLKEIAIKDNGTFGRWDEKLLKIDWGGINFTEWGIDIFDFQVEDDHKKEAKDTPIDNRKEWSIVLSADEFDFVNCTLRDIGPTPEKAFLSILGYGK